MTAFDVRRKKRLQIKSTLAALAKASVDGFVPGFFNQPQALALEATGMPLEDGVLGLILSSAVSTERQRVTEELLRRVASSLTPEERLNNCFDLHSTLALFLDRVGCPAIRASGTVCGISEDTERGFVINSLYFTHQTGTTSGHAWVITPDYRVIDLALKYQEDGGDDYALLRDRIPSIVVAAHSSSLEPQRTWWRMPNTNQFPPEEVYIGLTQYIGVLGWSLVENNGISLRYITERIDLLHSGYATYPNQIATTIGGLRPGDFFEKNLSDLRSETYR